jgi:transposase-like protein
MPLSNPGGSSSSKYPDELRERATRMAVEVRRDLATRAGALARVAGQLGINPETLRNRVHGVGVPLGHRGSDGFASPVTGPTESDAARSAAWYRGTWEAPAEPAVTA